MQILRLILLLLAPAICLSQKNSVPTFTTLSEALQYKHSVKNLVITYPISKDSMEMIGQFHSLQHLELSNQENRIMIDFSKLKQLQELVMNNNSGGLPESIPALPRLESITIYFNKLTELPLWACTQKNLKRIGIASNRIKTLPDCFFSLKKIETIYAGYNKLSIFDERMLYFPKLITLDISGNKITTLPDKLQLPSSLRTLNLQDNETSWDEINAFQKLLPKNVWLIHNEFKAPLIDASASACSDKDTSSVQIFTKCEICPGFQGGELKFKNFLNSRLDTSLIPSGDTFSTEVLTRFAVFREGGISKITIVESTNTNLSVESIRLIKESCAYWIPANFSGRLVNSWITLKLYFNNQVIDGVNHKSIRAQSISP